MIVSFVDNENSGEYHFLLVSDIPSIAVPFKD